MQEATSSTLREFSDKIPEQSSDIVRQTGRGCSFGIYSVQRYHRVKIPQILSQDKDYLYMAPQMEELLAHVEFVEM